MFDISLRKSRAAVRTIGPALRDAFTRGEIASMARLGTIVHFRSGENVILEGTPGSHAFFITNGTAAVKRADESIAMLNPGDLVGERALITGELRNATVTAMMPITALRFDSQQFAWLRLESPKVKSLSDELVDARS